MTAFGLEQIIEAALLAADEPLSLDRLSELFESQGRPKRGDIQDALETLRRDYEGRGVELVEVASGFRIQVRKQLSSWIGRLWEERPPRYSRALLETLAIIAYRQPVTRGEIEDIRGVGVGTNIVRTLMEREWVRVVGHRDVPGRPALLATTRSFLDYFNLHSLADLPTLPEIRALDHPADSVAEKRPEVSAEVESELSTNTGGIDSAEDARPADESSDSEAAKEQELTSP